MHRRNVTNSRSNHDAAVIEKSANVLHILPAAGINSRVSLMRMPAHPCAHGGAIRAHRLNLEYVPATCTTPCNQFANTRHLVTNTSQRVCTSPIVVFAQVCQPATTSDNRLDVQPKECPAHSPRLSAHQRAQFPRALSRDCGEHLTETSAHSKQELRHHCNTHASRPCA